MKQKPERTQLRHPGVPFPLEAWRRAVASAASGLGTEGIAPFGFEVTQSHLYLSLTIRYLFVYLRHAPGILDRSASGLAFLRTLSSVAPEVAGTIEILDFDRLLIKTDAKSATRTLVVRSIATPSSMLSTWSRYVVAAALPFNRGLLKAVTDYDEDLMSQRYCCQLAVAHDSLFGSAPGAPRIGHIEAIASHLRTLQSIGLEMRYETARVPTALARRLAEVIRIYYDDLEHWLGTALHSEVVCEVPDFHSAQVLRLPLGPVLLGFVDVTAARFMAYGHPTERSA